MSDKVTQKFDMKLQNKEEYKPVSLFRNPITVISTTIVLVYEQLMKLTNYLLTHRKVMVALILIFISCFFEGPHKKVKFNFTFTNQFKN